MPKFRSLLPGGLLLVSLALVSQAQTSSEIKIDPLLLVSLKECRHITRELGNSLFPGWEFQNTPILFYRPGVQDVLINFPHKPQGFREYSGFNPLGSERIFVRNDSTHFTIDGQNTSTQIDSVTTLVVADPYSNMRNSLQGAIDDRPKAWIDHWLANWEFMGSPYDQVETILHEAFHVYQHSRNPNKYANEMAVTKYPLLDPENNALYVLEGNLLKDALLQSDRNLKMEKIREFVAVRSYRQSRLDSSSVEYENLNEYNEGLAKYTEYKFLTSGQALKPIREMYYQQGFYGYKDVLASQYTDRLQNMVNVVAVNDDRFANKFGAGPMRFRLYELGACQAMLLDEVFPAWKSSIFNDGVYLTGQLQQAVPLSKAEAEHYLEQAKSEYHYDNVYRSKQQFQKDGLAAIQAKLDGILKTNQTLVKINYGGFSEKVGIGHFTPFGVTQVSPKSAIYDLVPIQIRFKEGSTLNMKQAIPVLLDRDQKMIAFTVPLPASNFDKPAGNDLDTDQFTLTGVNRDIAIEGNTVNITLK